MGRDHGRPGGLSSSTEPQGGSALRASIPDANSFRSRFHGKGLTNPKRSGAELKQTRKLRLLLVEAQGGRCHFCRRLLTAPTGGPLRGTAATVEHLLPRARGGALGPENCVAACHSCNRHRNCVALGKGSLRHHIIYFLRCIAGWVDSAAQAIEARRVETERLDAKHESAVAESDAPNPQPKDSSHDA